MEEEKNGSAGKSDEEVELEHPADTKGKGAGESEAADSGEERLESGEEEEGEKEREAGAGSEGAQNGEPDIEVLAEEREDAGGRMQKRMKHGSRKELLDHLHKKNVQLLDLDKEVKKLQQDIKIKEDRLMRLAAEFENYKKRTRREWDLLIKRANADLLKDIAGILDNIDRAFANLEGTDDRVQEGLKLIHAGLMDVLARNGLSEIDALGARFDPRFHEAVGGIASDEIEEGSVAAVIDKGYLLHGEVLRPARVMISKGKPDTA